MQYAPRGSVADAENRSAFLVQLRALLLQAKHLASGNQKGKLGDILADVEDWVKEVDGVGAPRPSIDTPSDGMAATLSTNQELQAAAAAVAVAVGEEQQQQDHMGESKGMDDTNGKLAGNLMHTTKASASASASVMPMAPPSTSTPQGDEFSSFTVDVHQNTDGVASVGQSNDVTSFSSNIGGRNLEDLADFLFKLFASDLPENPRLRGVGRNASRLSIVRCFSIIMSALEKAVQGAYTEAPAVRESSCGCGSEHASTLRRSLFVRLSHDIKVSADTILKCMELLTGQKDLASTRFAAQVCVDVLKQMRQCAIIFGQQVFREELRHLCAMEDARVEDNNDKSPSYAVEARQIAERRGAELRLLFGPAFLASTAHLTTLIRPAVRYLISVFLRRDVAGSQEEGTLRNDVCAKLFGLAHWVTPTAAASRRRKREVPPPSPLLSVRSSSLSSSSPPPPPPPPFLACKNTSAEECGPNNVREQSSTGDWRVPSGSLQESENSASASSLIYRSAALILESVVPLAFSPEYISSLAQHCGDESVGQLVAVRILNDTVTMLAEKHVEELQHMLGRTTWRKCIADGILKCLVSLDPAVLDAGLDTLHRIVAGCPESLGSEVGFLHTSCIFGLLETDTTPPALRRALLLYVIKTFFRVPGAPGQPSLLLRLYQHFDLNVRWHQLNVVQQTVSTLSNVVRRATPEEFSDLEESQTGDKLGKAKKARKSLPYLALQGLSLAVELLAVHVHKESDIPGGRALPRLTNRERKMEEQRMVDIINSSPVKGMRKLFDVTDEEMNPNGGAGVAEKNWAHQYIPPPPTPLAEAKVRRIAQFLMETPSLNPDSIAEFISHPAVYSLQVCQVFMESLPLAGKNLVDGLKELFTVVQPPKEGQRIERLLEFFCAAYFRMNSVECVGIDTFPFKSENACFILGVGILMLNTNLHNPHVSSEKMTAASFYAQLRGCNEGEDFPIRFTKNIFDEIRIHPLSGLNGLCVTTAGAAGGGVGNGSVRQAFGVFSGNMDSIFFSSEERRGLAFDAVRQRLVRETQGLMCRSSRLEPPVREQSPEFWWVAAEDLFLSIWPSLCGVFGVALQGAQIPEDAQMLCVRGLHSCFLVAAALNLQTECSASQLALLRMSSLAPVRDMCHSFVLEVAASPLSVHFSSECWVPVVELIVAVQKQERQQEQQKQRIQHLMRVELESVFSRVEEFTRSSCRECLGDDSPVRRTVDAMLNGIATILVDQSIDAPSLTVTLDVLRRFLSYTSISCDQFDEGTVGTRLINVHGFRRIVVPALVNAVDVRSGKGDECLHALVGFVVDVLGALWNSSHAEGDASKHVEVADCYAFFQLCYRRCETSMVVRMHLLQGIKELFSRTVYAEGSPKGRSGSGAGGGFHTYNRLEIMALMWQRLLEPIVRGLSEEASVGTEICSLAVHTLRKLVALCCGIGTPAVHVQLRKRVRNTLLLLLSEVAYMGGMCSDVDSAHSCLDQLSIICTSALKPDEATTPCEDEAPRSSADHHKAVIRDDEVGAEKLRLLHFLVQSLQRHPDALLLHTLERICLLLQCHTQQTRTEVISALHILVTQLQPLQLQHLAMHLSKAVLEALLVRAAPDCRSTVVNPTLVRCALFDICVPSTMMYMCSPTSFFATLPLVMKFMSHELLSGDHPEPVAEIVMKRCMLPLAVSPSSSAQIRTLAVRSLMHCASVSVVHQTANNDTSFLDTVADCVSLILLASHIPAALIVPRDAGHTGHRWVEEKRSASLAAYAQAGSDAIQALCTMEVHMVTGSRGSGMLCVDSDGEDTQVVDASLEREEFARSLRGSSLRLHGDVVTDEELVEYCTLMARLLSPLPKVLGPAPPLIHVGGNGADTKQRREQCNAWTPPPVTHEVFAELVLEAAGTFFAILWRVNHFVEMEEFMARSTPKGRDAPLLGKSSALLPHAAIRGGLNAFSALVMRINLSKFREVVLEVLHITAMVQTSTLNMWETQKMGEGTTENIALQRLNPQERQHIRSCNVGMYQELSSVLSYWIRIIKQQTDGKVSTLSAAEREELVNVACDPEVFTGFVRLLTVAAGAIITTTRDYLMWYIAACHQRMGRAATEDQLADGVSVLAHLANGGDTGL